MLVRIAYAVTFAFYAATNPHMWKAAAPYIITAAVAFSIGMAL